MRRTSRIVLILILAVAVFVVSRKAWSSASQTIPEIGAHTPILKFEKNENPQNLMIVYTKLDPGTCAFAANDKNIPVLDEYWMMDGTRYKRVHPLIKRGIGERLELDSAAYKGTKKFFVHLKDFRELNSDLGASPTVEIKPEKSNGHCDAFAEMRLGPSDGNRRIAVESIYAESSKKFLPPFRKLRSLTITGKDVATGEVIHRTYSAN